ncbi:MAG TPA: AmmeMemoRadiSam system protein B [Bryobacteraceae bacterium]|nr:AmmeMemoRadiSam system protein B [Bryobacteraceae bacterium]
MSALLPRLRYDLDAMPSPVEDRPGLLLRDSMHYSDAVLIIPPPLVECLNCFDGQHTELDLRAALVQITGDLQVGELERNLIDTLRQSGFLQDETFGAMKSEREREFAESLVRAPAHAGSGYPDTPDELRVQMDEWMSGPPAAEDGLIGIAAPHVSPVGGYQSYRSAYGLLGPGYKDRTFVILGTSHYGAPERFGLTRKPYATPWGNARTDIGLVDELTRLAPGAVATEDYCHSVEHSIEFQVVYLQSIYGPDIRILPILCGSYAQSIYRGGKPEDNENVARFLGVLGEIAAREGDSLMWLLGIDMAHMGRRYGDEMVAIANEQEMLAVEARDKLRMNSVIAGDSQGFWDQVQENHDDLKWCGSSPLYTFLKVMPQARGTVKLYEQWNIDPQSVVSFAGISFRV